MTGIPHNCAMADLRCGPVFQEGDYDQDKNIELTSEPRERQLGVPSSPREINIHGATQVGEGNTQIINPTTTNTYSNIHFHINIDKYIQNGSAPLPIDRHYRVEPGLPLPGLSNISQTGPEQPLKHLKSLKQPCPLCGQSLTESLGSPHSSHPNDQRPHDQANQQKKKYKSPFWKKQKASKTQRISDNEKQEECPVHLTLKGVSQSCSTDIALNRDNTQQMAKTAVPGQEHNSSTTRITSGNLSRHAKPATELSKQGFDIKTEETPDSYIVLDSVGHELQPGDIVKLTDLFPCVYTVYIGDLEVVWCDRDTQTIEKKPLDMRQTFCRYRPNQRNGPFAAFSPDEVAQRALSAVGRCPPIRETLICGKDFVVWAWTGLNRDQARDKGFRLT